MTDPSRPSSRQATLRAVIGTTVLAILSALGSPAIAATDGFLTLKGQKVFPVGMYEQPTNDAKAKELVESGVNLVACQSRDQLDRALKFGLQCWFTLPLDGPADDKLRGMIESVASHPALVVWEGPDEVIWNFTAWSALFRRGLHKERGEWRRQTPAALAYTAAHGPEVLKNIREGTAMVRRLDKRKLPIWLNEASESDLTFIRGYVDHVDITGFDMYPIHGKDTGPVGPRGEIYDTQTMRERPGTPWREPTLVADYAERFRLIGRGKPLWTVLQGLSWGAIGRPEEIAWPSFSESRLMAYLALTHGSRGVLYFGTDEPSKTEPFRKSLLAMTSELSRLGPFLVAPEQKAVQVRLIEATERSRPRPFGVSHIIRKVGKDWLLILVNEDDWPHLGVEVTGLKELEGKTLERIHGTGNVTVQRGEFIARMAPHDVQIFTTDRGKFESTLLVGRDYKGQ